ncbi:hypothetical protein [Actinokineospora enzanensis]|uniref:hypothetical protein n=1 Tax=Actinokineospora enzanensis TaxID=155975 RepID=UPI00039DBD51|nr:hypothetical protein [Actinokineospora enzanensis]
MTEQQRPRPVAPKGGADYLLSRLPQATAEIVKNADPTQPWPVGVPSLVDDLNDLIKYAEAINRVLELGSLGDGLEVAFRPAAWKSTSQAIAPNPVHTCWPGATR